MGFAKYREDDMEIMYERLASREQKKYKNQMPKDGRVVIHSVSTIWISKETTTNKL